MSDMGWPTLEASDTSISLLGTRKKIPGSTDAHVLGRFYNKQIDTLVAHPDRGPVVMVSSKTMTSNFSKNIPNRSEEAIGDGTNLKERFPIAPLGFAMLVRSTVFAEAGAYPGLDNLVRSVQTEAGRYNAATLIVAEWNDPPNPVPPGWDPGISVLDAADSRIPSDDLAPSFFFKQLLEALFATTPVDFYAEARRRWGYTAPGHHWRRRRSRQPRVSGQKPSAPPPTGSRPCHQFVRETPDYWPVRTVTSGHEHGAETVPDQDVRTLSGTSGHEVATGSSPPSDTIAMSRDIGKGRTCIRFGPWSFSAGLVAAGGAKVRWRRSSPMVVATTRMSRSAMMSTMGVPAWARPMLMWCMRPARRRDTAPVLSMRSRRIR